MYVKLNSQTEFEKASIKDGHQLRWTKVGVLTIMTKEDYATGVASSSLDNQGSHEEANKVCNYIKPVEGLVTTNESCTIEYSALSTRRVVVN